MNSFKLRFVSYFFLAASLFGFQLSQQNALASENTEKIIKHDRQETTLSSDSANLSATPFRASLLTSQPDPKLVDAKSLNLVFDTNVSGGGFQGDVSITENGLTVYSSADVSGVFKSTNGGLRFRGRNKGLESYKVASLAITSDNEQIVYAGTGNKGETGGLFRSDNGGNSWVLTSDGAKARFAGNHSVASDPVPNGHPRSNGDLIVVDQGDRPETHTDDIVIAGSYKDGVRFFTQGGDREISAVNTSGFVRSVARDPSLPNTVFAAIQFANSDRNGIYRIDYTDLSSPTSNLAYATPQPEGLAVLSSGHVYGAIGAEGIVKFNGTSWVLQNSGLSVNNRNRQWTAVTGYVARNNDVVYAGTNNSGGNANGANYSTIWRTTNGGNSWSPLVDANTNVDDTILGQTHDWWYSTDAFRQAGLGRKNSVVSSIAVARGPSRNLSSDDIIYVSGRGGIWASKNGGDSWRPAVSNMQVTSNRGVAVNPNNPGQVVLSNTDYVVLETRSGFKGADLSRDKPGGAESRSYDSIFDAVSDEIIVAVGDRDTNNPGGGEVFVKPASALGAPSGAGWTNTNLGSSTSSNDGRVRAVTYGYHDGTSFTTQTILAAVEGEGVFRLHNGTWSKSRGVSIGSTDRSNFVWPDSTNSGDVYLLDLSKGLYRSNDGGQNWVNIWPGMSLRNNNFFNTGYITADDNNPTTLYLSIQGDAGSPIRTGFKVYRMTDANSRIFGEPGTSGITDITKHSGDVAIQRPGPLAIGPTGNLLLTQQQDSRNSITAGLFSMDNPASDSSFTELTTEKYRRIAVSPSGIAISGDGYAYISQTGVGVVKVKLP